MMPFSAPLTDDYVADLLRREADAAAGQNADPRYHASDRLLSRPARSAHAPKPNTRFLRNIIRDTDSHNAALKAREEADARARRRAASFRPHGDEDNRRRARDDDGVGGGERTSRIRFERGARERGRLSRSRSPETSTRAIDEKEEDEEEEERSRRRRRRRRRSERHDEAEGGDRKRRRRGDREEVRRPERRPSSRTRSRSPAERRDREHERRKDRKDARSDSRRLAPPPPPPPPPEKDEVEEKEEEEEKSEKERGRKGSDSDPLEAIVGPLPPPKVLPRGRGAHKVSAIDVRFGDAYNPVWDVDPDVDEDGDDWNMALGALRDRAKWRTGRSERLRAAGFTDEEVQRFVDAGDRPNASEKDAMDVRWSKRGEKREWDRGKVVKGDRVELAPEWGRLKGTG